MLEKNKKKGEKEALRCSIKKDFLTNLATFIGKTPVLESLFSELAGIHACNFIKKRHQHRFFPVNIAKLFNGCF